MSTMSEGIARPATGRLVWLDLARAVALAAMVVFHFTRDLEMFGLIAPRTTLTGGWLVFGRLIAGSFLFLSGVSMVLAHGGGVRLRSFLRRLAVIVGAALLISVATWIAVPEVYIYFGILHSIAAASVVGVVFLRAPAAVLIAAALAVVAVEAAFGRALGWPDWLMWTGLTREIRPSLDLVPLIPWLAPFFAGMALARLVLPERLEPRWTGASAVQALSWPGRHSLAVYLVHQPVLVSLLWLATRFG